MELLPIKEHLEENKEFIDRPECLEALRATIDFYKKVGFEPPWIGYFVSTDHTLVGSAGFKGKPVGRKVEIAYGTFPAFQRKGIGAATAGHLVQIARTADATLRIMARTLPEENYSARILRKNGFELKGSVMDEEDGEVWEWEYKNHTSQVTNQ